jgi:dephospho-CoA kinase
MGRVFVLGMAGGIGAGKSAVAEELSRRGAQVLDADAMVHELLKRPEVAQAVAARFGREVLSEDGTVDRKKLGKIAFSDEKHIRDLEKVLHPAVIEASRKRIEELRRQDGTHVVAINAPLLFEAGMDAMCDAVVFVDVSEEVRLERLRAARNWSADELHRREKHQKSLDYKKENAEFVIRNDLSRRHTAEQVDDLWAQIQDRLNPRSI